MKAPLKHQRQYAKIMKRAWFLPIPLAILLVTGCLNFGKDEETTAPTKVQIDRCRLEMHISPSLKITPLGYKLEGLGIDDAIWFKFKTNEGNLGHIFNPMVVDASKFKKDFRLDEAPEIKWWDVKGKKLLGGQVELPNVRFMNVGIEKSREGCAIYIMWHEV